MLGDKGQLTLGEGSLGVMLILHISFLIRHGGWSPLLEMYFKCGIVVSQGWSNGCSHLGDSGGLQRCCSADNWM